MSKKFSEKFHSLVNCDVPRITSGIDEDNSDIPAERRKLELDDLPKPSSDGFIATYCSKKSRN